MQLADSDHYEVQSDALHENQRRLNYHAISLDLLREEDLALYEHTGQDH